MESTEITNNDIVILDFNVEELEARFEMQAMSAISDPDVKCTCSIEW